MTKILIVSHNPLSNSQSNGKTISSILSCFKKTDLAQLYFTLDVPDYDVCENFFRITDVDILKNFLLMNKNVGNIITEKYSLKNKEEKKGYHKNLFYNFIRKLFVSKISIMTSIRDFVWQNSDFYSKKFEEWIDKFNPDVVFFQSSNCCFAFEFVLKICKKRGIRVMIETTDDYLSYKKLNLFYNYNVYKLRRCYKELNKYCDLILPISDDMKEYYQRMFPNNYYTVMNSVTFNNKKNEQDNKIDKFLYAGNLALGRWKVIYNLAKAVNSIESNIKIEVYSIDPPSQKIINKLNEFECCKYGYSLNKEELTKKIEESDVLLHVESFSKSNRHLTKYSISTKIPELMNSGKKIFAIGPNDISSIKYLLKTKTGFVLCTNKNKEIVNGIKEFSKINKFDDYISNCKKIVSENHDIKKVQKYIKKFVEDNYE